MNSLPLSENLDISIFSNLFSETTNSYKYLFFQAILNKLLENHFQERVLNLKDLAISMCRMAKYPIEICKLQFGKQDRMPLYIYDEKLSMKELLRYVPYRILSIFFKKEWKDANLEDSKKDKFLEEISRKFFSTHKPLYQFLSKENIEIHPDWLNYIRKNYSIIESWGKWHYLEYLQKNNPNIPNIANKLEEPKSRSSLKKQNDFWLDYLQNQPFRCIYSNELLSSSFFSLDHFIPWNFVGHDRIWNLVPVNPSLNSSKSDNLAHLKYIKPLILAHYNLLEYYLEKSNFLEQNVFIEEYELDLKINFEQGLQLQTFYYNFTSTLHPLMRIARNLGFNSGWEYS